MLQFFSRSKLYSLLPLSSPGSTFKAGCYLRAPQFILVLGIPADLKYLLNTPPRFVFARVEQTHACRIHVISGGRVAQYLFHFHLHLLSSSTPSSSSLHLPLHLPSARSETAPCNSAPDLEQRKSCTSRSLPDLKHEVHPPLGSGPGVQSHRSPLCPRPRRLWRYFVTY